MAIELDKLEFSATDNWEQSAKECPWLAFIPEYARDENGQQEFMRARGRTQVYRLIKREANGSEEHECATCNSPIMSATIAHSIWDSPIPMSGSGKCHYEGVPYCPKCEEKPKFHGSPIEIGPKFR